MFLSESALGFSSADVVIEANNIKHTSKVMFSFFIKETLDLLKCIFDLLCSNDFTEK
jgi:hypothetical protein